MKNSKQWPDFVKAQSKTEQKETLINEFLQSINNIDNIDFNDFLSPQYVDWNNFKSFSDILEYLDDQRALEVEIIYYASAIEYLRDEDPSLIESLEIASDLGFELKNLNSETLASLLASERLREEIYDIESEFNDFLNELNDLEQ
jgi:hypothetical protein